MVAPEAVGEVIVIPVGCVVGVTAVGLFTSTGTFREHVPVL